MPRRRFRQPVRYAFAEHEGPHRVVDQHHGYALGGHTTRAAAEATAREPASNTTAAIPAIAAIAAMEALDAAQTDPAAAEPPDFQLPRLPGDTIPERLGSLPQPSLIW
ncbi:hypothetical protein ACSHXN_39985 [Streptomyces sp. HUAS TT11]|uniref:hypothetical protein n=1 Tax=Streptomyces sp. HUAS TT11 TaxID=3447508 RepID=UPI003F65ADEE